MRSVYIFRDMSPKFIFRNNVSRRKVELAVFIAQISCAMYISRILSLVKLSQVAFLFFLAFFWPVSVEKGAEQLWHKVSLKFNKSL